MSLYCSKELSILAWTLVKPCSEWAYSYQAYFVGNYDSLKITVQFFTQQNISNYSFKRTRDAVSNTVNFISATLTIDGIMRRLEMQPH